MSVLDIQRRGQQIGRIRIGQKVTFTDSSGRQKERPGRLDTFRFTTASRTSAQAIADLFGGTVRDWEGQYEVVTSQSEIGVTVPPRDAVISQHYEMWTKGGCQRRCDSQTDQISGRPCLCPHAENPGDPDEVARAAHERAMLAAQNPPKACKLVTRISVMIPDLPGLGVFRLDTGSYYAAVEIGDAAELMQMARDKGVFLPAMLRIEQRSRVAGGTTKKYPVPVLEVLATFRDLASGAIEARGLAGQLPPPPGEQRRAITAAPRPAAQEVPRQAPEAGVTAERIASLIPLAQTREDVEKLVARAESAKVADDYVCTDQAGDLHEAVRELLKDRWRELPATQPAAGVTP